MDVEQLAFDDGKFDKAVLMYALSGFPDPVKAMAEVQRVCKPGATLVLVNQFRSARTVARLGDILLAPIYRLLRYRSDLDVDQFLQDASLELLEQKPANLFRLFDGTRIVAVVAPWRRHERRSNRSLTCNRLKYRRYKVRPEQSGSLCSAPPESQSTRPWIRDGRLK